MKTEESVQYHQIPVSSLSATTTLTSYLDNPHRTCTACQLPLENDFVCALEGEYHRHCFLCYDCHEPVADKYFPIELDDGTPQPLCKTDYFKRLQLTCDNCGDILKGSYITAVGKKFHLEHFCCSICSKLFGPDDSYYEHGNDVYCHYHYSVKFAINCTGCETAILKQFVEINRNNIDEHWHPECYMIQKFWNVKLAQSFSEEDSAAHLHPSQLTPQELTDTQNLMEDKVYRIWTILSAFEESAAGCISDMLLHVSEGNYAEGVRMADNFITQVDVLFTAIDDLADRYYKQLKERIKYDRESSMLCYKVINFFSLLSQTQESGPRKIGITQELLSLVTGLAHFLKVLIRIGLTGTLRLERKNDPKATAINNFLTQLITIDNKKTTVLAVDNNASDLCQSCQSVCEEACYRYESSIWHESCFNCSVCTTSLCDDYREVHVEQNTLYCKQCLQVEGYSDLEYVTKLKQSSFLLRIALKRLYNTLNVEDPIVYYNQYHEQLQKQQQQQQIQQQLQQLQHLPVPNLQEPMQITDIKQMRPTQMNRKVTNSHRIGKRSTLMETPSPNAAFVSTNPCSRRESVSTENSKRVSQYENNLGDLSQMTMANSHSQMYQKYNKIVSKSKSYYFAELGSLDHFMVKHIAVLYLEEILHDQFSMEELTDLIDDKKNSTLWGRFVMSLKTGGNKKMPKPKEGTFGVPLEILVEKNGIESNLGVGPSRIIKIPAFIDESLSAMKKMDITVEGVFRKSGNIRRLKELCDEIDRNPNGVQLSNEGPVQVAALIKKFLRDLPDPLLTFRLHRLFITAQKLESEAERKRVTHLACCLLPKTNRDTMEVLFLFMKWVAQFAELENGGNKMDIANLATVIAPNILYSKGEDPIIDESYLSIQCTTMLLKYPEEFATVPEDFVPLLNNLIYAESDMEMNVRQVLKKCEEVVHKNKRTGSSHSHPRSAMMSPATPTAIIQDDQTSYFSSSPQKYMDSYLDHPIKESI